jgi:hypothetical protein
MNSNTKFTNLYDLDNIIDKELSQRWYLKVIWYVIFIFFSYFIFLNVFDIIKNIYNIWYDILFQWYWIEKSLIITFINYIISFYIMFIVLYPWFLNKNFISPFFLLTKFITLNIYNLFQSEENILLTKNDDKVEIIVKSFIYWLILTISIVTYNYILQMYIWWIENYQEMFLNTIYLTCIVIYTNVINLSIWANYVDNMQNKSLKYKKLLFLFWIYSLGSVIVLFWGMDLIWFLNQFLF